MKKLSFSLIEVLYGRLQPDGLTGLIRFGTQGGVVQALGCSGDGLVAGTLRFGLEESIEAGGVYVQFVGGAFRWVFALEHMHVLQGGLCGILANDAERVQQEGELACTEFYAMSGWNPTLLQARRQDRLRRAQMAEAARQPDVSGVWRDQALASEQLLLARIRAGDRTGARKLLNQMLATIYLSAPEPAVLRARVIELLSSLTRAAVEDNTLLAFMIEQNHRWIDHMVHAESFESLSTLLMQALDAFISAVHLHGSNRTNTHVYKALTYISEHFQESISLQEVARHAGVSSYRLAHLFRAHTGKTVVETIRYLRLQRAEWLLRQTGMTCAEVGYEVGFTDQSYFTLHFKRHTGMSPRRFRQAQGGG